jgi:hypothetical protein
MSVVDDVLGVALLAAGVVAVGIGGWSATTGRRPRWLSQKTIRPGLERLWGLGMGLAGLALLIQAAANLGWVDAGIRAGSIGLMFGAVALLIAATPVRGTPKRGQ